MFGIFDACVMFQLVSVRDVGVGWYGCPLALDDVCVVPAGFWFVVFRVKFCAEKSFFFLKVD